MLNQTEHDPAVCSPSSLLYNLCSSQSINYVDVDNHCMLIGCIPYTLNRTSGYPMDVNESLHSPCHRYSMNYKSASSSSVWFLVDDHLELQCMLVTDHLHVSPGLCSSSIKGNLGPLLSCVWCV